MQIRAAALTATQCASYDQAKQWWMRTTGMGDSFATHFGASMLTGLATTTVTAPVDLIKTRMFMSGRHYRTGPDRLSQSKQHVHTGVSPPRRLLLLLPSACFRFAVSEESAVRAQECASAHMQGVADNAKLDPMQAGRSTVLW